MPNFSPPTARAKNSRFRITSGFFHWSNLAEFWPGSGQIAYFIPPNRTALPDHIRITWHFSLVEFHRVLIRFKTNRLFHSSKQNRAAGSHPGHLAFFIGRISRSFGPVQDKSPICYLQTEPRCRITSGSPGHFPSVLPMSCPCPAHVLPMSCSCPVHALHMPCPCSAHALHMLCPRSAQRPAHALHNALPACLPAYALFMPCPCSVHALPCPNLP